MRNLLPKNRFLLPALKDLIKLTHAIEGTLLLVVVP